MKYRLWLAVMVVGITVLLPLAAWAQRYATVSTRDSDTVNVRSSAGTQHRIKGQINRGDRVEIGDSQRVGNDIWYLITRPGDNPLSGWVRGDFLQLEATRPTPAAPSDETVLAFQSQNYAVRVYRRNEQLKMNVYSKRDSTTFINGGSATTALPRGSEDNWISYVYRGEVTVYARINPNGDREFELIQTTGNRIVEAGY